MSFTTEMLEIGRLPSKHECDEVEGSMTALEHLSLSPRNSCSQQRLVYIKGIILEEMRHDTNSIHERLIPLIKQLHKDGDDDVKVVVMGLLPSIGEMLNNKDAGKMDGVVQLVQCSASLLSDASNYVREAALTAFDALTTYLTPFEQERHVVPVIAELLGSENKIDRVCGLLLLVSLIEKGIVLGGETRLINWLSQLLCDEDYEVRQELTSLYPAFLKALSQEKVQKTILPHFKFLVQDKVWSVRKAAAESLHTLLEYIPEGPESLDLQSMVKGYYAKLSADTSYMVRAAARQSIGDILANLDASLISEDMVDVFVSFAKESSSSLSPSPSSDTASAPVLNNFAKIFSTVATKIGSNKWNQIRNLFSCLIQSVDEETLSSLSGSLHELAHLLPPDIFRRDVMPFLSKMMHGGPLNAHSGIAEHFVPLVTALNGELQELCLFHSQHLMHIDIVHVESETPSEEKHNRCVTFFTKGWRVRYSLARQLSQLASLLDSDLVCEYVLPHAFHLCEDSVAHVRLEAARQLVEIMEVQQQNQSSLILAQLKKWHKSTNFKTRCIAAVICRKTQQKALTTGLKEDIDQIIQKLKLDSVADVRRLL